MRVGYVRVSGVDQNTVRQLEGVEVERVFTDTASGKDTARPKLEEMLRFVRDGDTVFVHSMDRLARNLDDLRRIVRTVTGKGARVEFVQERLAFTGEDSPMATLMLSVMGAFAEFERALIRERQREGIAAAKARGVYTGRKPALTLARAVELCRRAAAGESKAALAREYRISRETVYAYLRAGDAAPAQVLAVETSPAPPEDTATSASGRVVDLSAELGDGWQLVGVGEGLWRVQRDDVPAGTVRREATSRGRRGWRARLTDGVDVPASGDLAAARGSSLWRTRDLAAAGIAHHFTQRRIIRRR